MKKTNLVKSLSMALAIVLIASCMTGCGTKPGSENNSSGDATKIQVKYWLSGLGSEWLDAVVEGFEEKYPQYDVVVESTSNKTAVTTAFGKEDIDETDLYLCTKMYNTDGYLEPLDDILESTIDGEAKTIGEKFDDSYLILEKEADGHYYNLTTGGSMVGIYYNEKMFKDAGITQEPRTTDELVVVCDTLYADGKKAFCHFKPVGYWEDYMADVFFTQYNGLDYVLNNFYGCTDEAGNSPSLDVFTKEDGRYEALKVFAQVVTPEYTMVGSNTYDHTTVQTMWLKEEAAMMVTGSWLTSEMASVEGGENTVLMKTPVLSSLVDKLTTVKTEKDLRATITAIDNVTDGSKDEAAYKQGENYVIDGITVSAADWNYIRAARNTMATNASGNSAYIPKYADAKEGAKEFLKYMYSDEGYKLYANTLQQTLPLTLSSGELDISGWTEPAKKQAKILETTEQLISSYNAGKHDIFISGGAKWKAFDITYCDKFCSNNANDRMTAAEAFKDSVEYAKDNYETNWLPDMK